MSRYLFLVLMVSALLFGCRNDDVESELFLSDAEEYLSTDSIINEKVDAMPIINVAIVPNSPDYYLKGFHAEGYYLEKTRELRSQYKAFVNYVSCKNVAEAIAMIKDGRCDIGCIDNIMEPGEWYRHIEFTSSVANEKLVLVQRKADTGFIYTPTQLAGDTLFCAGNPTVVNYLKQLVKKLKNDFKVVSIDTVSDMEMVEMVNKGRLKYAVVSSRYGECMKPVFPDLDFSTALSFYGNRYWIYRKDNKFLKQELQRWIKAMPKSKSYGKGFATAYRNRHSAISEYDAVIKRLTNESGINPYFLIALAYHESTFYSNLVSPKGAYGLLQLMPSTFEQYGIDTTANVVDQIAVGVKFVNQIKSRYAKKVANDIDLYAFVLAAYNSGVGRVDEAMALSKKNKLNKNVWWGNVEIALKYVRRSELISPDSSDDDYKGHHTYFFVRNVMESYNHFRNLRE